MHTEENIQLLDLNWHRLIHKELYSHVDFQIKKLLKGQGFLVPYERSLKSPLHINNK